MNPENILGVHAVVEREASDLQIMLRKEEQYATLPALGSDPVSGDMSVAFNAATVGGYAATTTGSGLSEPRWYCAMLVDAAPGQSLLVDYSVESQDIPEMTHAKACDKAQTAAGFMLANLRAAQPKADR